MAFNPNVVAAGVSAPRSRIKTVAIGNVPVAPPASYVVDGVTYTQPAERVGQIRFARENPNTRKGNLYVVVDIDGVLQWKLVQLGGFIDGATGRTWDPLANAYDPLLRGGTYS